MQSAHDSLIPPGWVFHQLAHFPALRTWLLCHCTHVPKHAKIQNCLYKETLHWSPKAGLHRHRKLPSVPADHQFSAVPSDGQQQQLPRVTPSPVLSLIAAQLRTFRGRLHRRLSTCKACACSHPEPWPKVCKLSDRTHTTLGM